jgi:hypothetical protein
MGGKMQIQHNELEQLLELAASCRSQTLSICELGMGSSPQWKFIRNRLLNIFGERGLQGKILEIMGSESNSEVRYE